MIKEKREPIITMMAVFMAVVVAVLSLFVGSSSTVLASEPAYMTSLFSKDSVITIDILMDETAWDEMIENATAEEYVPCDVIINGTTIKNVAIRPKGNSSLTQVASYDTTDRFSFKLSFDEYVTGQNYDGLSSLALNNVISDPTYMKEYLSYEMMESMDIATPGYAYASICKNGEDWGLYLAVEILDTDFLSRNYGSNYGNLYKPESDDMNGGGNKEDRGDMGSPPTGRQRPGQTTADTETTTDDTTTATISSSDTATADAPPTPPDGTSSPPDGMTPPDNTTTATTDETAPDATTGNNVANQRTGGGMGSSSSSGTSLVYTDDNIDSYPGVFDGTVTKNTTTADKQKIIAMMKALSTGENIESVLDVDEVLRYFAVNTFLVNLDSYAGSLKHNYYLYEKNGVVQILPWDFNLSFGAFQSGSASQVINFPIDAPVTDTMENSPLIAKLLENDEYKALYHEYLEALITTWTSNGFFNSEIERIDALISDLVSADATAFYTAEEYEASLVELKTYGAERTASILAQLSGEQPSDSYGTMTSTINLQTLGSNGGGGGGGFGGGNLGTRDEASQGDTTTTPTITSPDFAERGNKTNSPQNAQSAFSAYDIFLICFLSALLLGGIIFALMFKRRKHNLN